VTAIIIASPMPKSKMATGMIATDGEQAVGGARISEHHARADGERGGEQVAGEKAAERVGEMADERARHRRPKERLQHPARGGKIAFQVRVRAGEKFPRQQHGRENREAGEVEAPEVHEATCPADVGAI
jgi:hypothetical protein